MRNHIQLILLPSKTRRSFIHSALIRVEKEKKEERRKKKERSPIFPFHKKPITPTRSIELTQFRMDFAAGVTNSHVNYANLVGQPALAERL